MRAENFRKLADFVYVGAEKLLEILRFFGVYGREACNVGGNKLVGGKL